MKKFLCGVGIVTIKQNGLTLFKGKTLLDSGIEISTSSTEISGGIGNPLQYIYYHSGRFNVTIADTQWSLSLISMNTGAMITNGGNVLSNETVTIAGGKGVLVGTPISLDGKTPVVTVEYEDSIYNFEYNSADQSFTVIGGVIPDGTIVCVGYVNTITNGKTITIPANIIPDQVEMFIEASLFGDNKEKGALGKATIYVPRFQLSGAQTISMTSDGYSNTPLNGMALSFEDNVGGCTNGAYYAKITEEIFGINWYDDANGLAIEEGDFELAVAATSKLNVWYVANGKAYLAPNSDLTFTSGTPATATVATTGVVTGVAAGTSLLTVKITAKPTIEASATVTVA